MKKSIFSLILPLLFFLNSGAQVTLPGTYFYTLDQYERLQSDSTEYLTYHPSIHKSDSEGFSFLDPYAQLSYNSAYPRSYNDGLIWKGKGLTQELHGGFRLKKGILNLTFYPAVYFSQNLSFDLASINSNQNEYSYQFGVSRQIDYVQRYGDDPFAQFHLGQSEIGMYTKYFEIAASTQNFTLGPGVYNSITMSNTAPGIPHIRLGTPGKTKLKVKDLDLGALELNLFYGLMNESDYFDTLSNNNTRYFNALTLAYEIPGLKGLSVGFNKVLYKDLRHFEPSDLYSVFYIKDDGIIGDTLDTGNDTFDQLASAFIEWKIPEQDMRIYFEFARADFNGSFRRFITEFEHSRGYALGLEKIFKTQSGEEIMISYEHTFLNRFQSYLYRPTPPFYSHHVNTQGYTNDGQLMGAGIGPGSVSDFFNLLWLKSKYDLGLSMQRIRFDEDYFFSRIPNDITKIDKHDIEYTVNFTFAQYGKRMTWGTNAGLSYRFNMYYEPNNDMVNFSANLFAKLNLSKE